MFGKTGDAATSRDDSVIQDGVTVRGEVKAEGDIRIEGHLDGTLVCKARVVIGAKGSLLANVTACEIVVMGRVLGDIVCNHRIELRKGAHVEGDLSTESLVIEEGVFFQGSCHMAADQGPSTSPVTESAPFLAKGPDVEPQINEEMPLLEELGSKTHK